MGIGFVSPGSGGGGGTTVFEKTYESTGAYVLLESWAVGENEIVSVTAHITLGYQSAGAFGVTIFAHGHGRRFAGNNININGTDPLNDGGNVLGDDVRWQGVNNALELQIRTTYVGNVTVQWDRTVRRFELPA